jgi:formylglycine-generating enzyme required for sulfatase activity
MNSIRITGYRTGGLIGHGGMGTVFAGVHETLDRPVALKVLHEHLTRDPEIVLRFHNEARLMALLQHPNIVQLYDFREENGRLVLILEFVDGFSLDAVIGQKIGPIPHEKALPLFKQILSGIAYAHSKGVIHRDIKPSNIIVNNEACPKVTDFGIAKIAGQMGMTRTGTKLGTIYYMSPEQVLGAKNIDHRSDIYSLGMTLYEMLAGRLPFDGEQDTSEYAIMDTIARKELPDPRTYYPHIPEWLVQVIRKATAKEPQNRYQSCAEFIHTLDQNVVQTGTPPQFEGIHQKKSDGAPVSDKGNFRINEQDVPLPGMRFVVIPSGSFKMGSPSSESERDSNEGPVHTVTMKSFELMTTEVTQGMWKAVMGTSIRDEQRVSGGSEKLPGEGVDYPMYFISWNNCQDFIDRMNSRDARHTYRLPSEAEWEFACRAGTTTAYYWGRSIYGDYCWYSDNSNSTTHPVGQKLPNAWGLYDMSGNVWEWCEDWYHKSYSGAPTDGSAWVSPSGSYRVIRGGGWLDNAGNCRSANRSYSPGRRYNNLGFRLARSVR